MFLCLLLLRTYFHKNFFPILIPCVLIKWKEKNFKPDLCKSEWMGTGLDWWDWGEEFKAYGGYITSYNQMYIRFFNNRKVIAVGLRKYGKVLERKIRKWLVGRWRFTVGWTCLSVCWMNVWMNEWCVYIKCINDWQLYVLLF